MAFLKPIEIRNTGLVTAYWRLTHSQTDYEAGIVEFRLCGYPDQDARAAGKTPLPCIAFRLSPEALAIPSLHEVTTPTLYAAARCQPATDGIVWFRDAVDC
ncbi:hypothetical protein ACFQY5_28655 [Paeniroseomonas aquatica]|uniref:Uncharacterized protein n=1 Tax=Paeniroseomonas aquatica TaxID=373043 RepID=A0ABT8AFF8_9PROT|nr:hypothetical protein [Paeniroseomonas aquatica]MDN3568216.1 hypothetical protein [Paeniroseomonas aquatica]